MRLAAKYCDEINVDLPADALPDAIALLADRCEEIGRDPATLDIVTGTNPAWPYPGLRAIGRQRLMKKEDLPAIMPYDFDNLLPRADRWPRGRARHRQRHLRRPGLVDTDEGVYELLDDLRTAGIERPVPAYRGERIAMQIGLVLPQGYFNEFEGWEPGRAWARIVELAQSAEKLGFELIWTGEHPLSKWPGESIAFDCWALSSAVCAARAARRARHDRARTRRSTTRPSRPRRPRPSTPSAAGG